MKNLAGRISTPSMAVALTALFIALSGTAIALPGKNRVDKNDYKRGSVGVGRSPTTRSAQATYATARSPGVT